MALPLRHAAASSAFNDRSVQLDHSSPSIAENASPWKRSSEQQRERELKCEAVLRMAARVFNDEGSHAVSPEEIADLLHVARPTLCYYFKNNDQILQE